MAPIANRKIILKQGECITICTTDGRQMTLNNESDMSGMESFQPGRTSSPTRRSAPGTPKRQPQKQIAPRQLNTSTKAYDSHNHSIYFDAVGGLEHEPSFIVPAVCAETGNITMPPTTVPPGMQENMSRTILNETVMVTNRVGAKVYRPILANRFGAPEHGNLTMDAEEYLHFIDTDKVAVANRTRVEKSRAAQKKAGKSRGKAAGQDFCGC